MADGAAGLDRHRGHPLVAQHGFHDDIRVAEELPVGVAVAAVEDVRAVVGEDEGSVGLDGGLDVGDGGERLDIGPTRGLRHLRLLPRMWRRRLRRLLLRSEPRPRAMTGLAKSRGIIWTLQGMAPSSRSFAV